MGFMTMRFGCRVAALMLAAGAVVAAQAAQGPRDLLVRARLAEENAQTLGRALELYRQAAAQAGDDRALVAEAELGAALVLERQGSPDARDALVAVSRRYAELAAGRTASARLADLGSQNQSVVPRLIRNDANFPRAISFDGRKALLLVPRAPGRNAPLGSLVVQDVASGELTTLVEAQDDAWPGSAIFSPDGQQVAYAWSTIDRSSASGPQSMSLRVIAAQAGAEPRTVLGPAPPGFSPFAWSPDGTSIYITRRELSDRETGPELLRVSVADGQIQHLASFEGNQGFAEPSTDFPGLGLRLSPDGQTVAYSISDPPGSQDRYIYTLDTTTLERRALVTMAGVNTRATWGPDGSQLFFVNDLSGRRSLWVVGVRAGAAEGEPRQLVADFQGSPVDMTVTGQLYNVRMHYAGFVESVAERNPAGSPIVQTFFGQSGMWSKDNKLAFIRRGVDDVADLIVRDMATGEERTFRRPGGFALQSVRWLPDNSGFIVFLNGNVDPGGPAFYRLDLASGRLDYLFARDAADHQRSAGALVSADGRSLYLLVRGQLSSAPERRPGFGPPQVWSGVVAVDLATGVERPLFSFPGDGLRNNPSWALSPDGQTLAFSTVVENVRPARSRLVTVGIDGSNWREIHQYDADPWVDILRWTPDGQSLLFIEGHGGPTWRMMRIPAAGGTAVFDGLDSASFTGTVPLPAYEVANLANFDVSPDGRQVVFGSRTVPTYDLTVLENVLTARVR